jgi:hypothetical protein
MALQPEVIRGDEAILDACFLQLSKDVPASAVFVCDGVTYQQPDLVKEIEAQRAPYKAVRSSKTASKTAREDLKAKKASIHQFVKGLQTGIKGYLGENNPQIVDYGFKENKRSQPLSSEKLLERTKKARRTRDLRHTMGSQQKKHINATEMPETPPGTTSGTAGNKTS